MANLFKNVIDRMEWVQVPAAPNAHAAAACMCSDMRSDRSRNPFVYQLVSASVLNRFNITTKSWHAGAVAPALAGTFGAGAACAFAPSFGAVGVLATGNANNKVILSTALGTAVGQGRQADAVFHIEAAGAVGPAEDGVKKGLLFFVGHAAASVAVSAGASSSLTSSPRTT